MPRNYEVFPVVGKCGRGRRDIQPHPPTLPLRVRARACVWRKRCLWRPQAASPVELSVTTAPSQPPLRAEGFSPGWGYHLRQPSGLSPLPSRPDLALMYKNKLVRRATHASVRVYECTREEGLRRIRPSRGYPSIPFRSVVIEAIRTLWTDGRFCTFQMYRRMREW